MFRTGGSAGTGITSGLVPRQGYGIGGLSDQDIAEIKKQARELTQGDRRADMNQFLIDFGLNMVSGTPKSNIVATAAEELRGHLQQCKNLEGQEEHRSRICLQLYLKVLLIQQLVARAMLIEIKQL